MWAAVRKDGEFYLTHIPDDDSMLKKRICTTCEKGIRFIKICL